MSIEHDWHPKELPIAIDVESKAVLKRLPKAHAALAELKGIASTIPNRSITDFFNMCVRITVGKIGLYIW
jgi:hypothetical protein